MTNSIVTIHGGQWKAQDILEPVEWAKGEKWEKALWSSLKHGDDHDHCQICWWKLCDSDDPVIGEGYISGKYNWLCSECYEQFVKSKP